MGITLSSSEVLVGGRMSKVGYKMDSNGKKVAKWAPNVAGLLES